MFCLCFFTWKVINVRNPDKWFLLSVSYCSAWVTCTQSNGTTCNTCSNKVPSVLNKLMKSLYLWDMHSHVLKYSHICTMITKSKSDSAVGEAYIYWVSTFKLTVNSELHGLVLALLLTCVITDIHKRI